MAVHLTKKNWNRRIFVFQKKALKKKLCKTNTYNSFDFFQPELKPFPIQQRKIISFVSLVLKTWKANCCATFL
jgi:hypothetical protein